MAITEIRTGGQTGVDRGAFAAARELGVPISGWCPEGGWAEDMPDPPGLLSTYPEMTETIGDSGTQTRTEWNIRDSDYCVVFHDPMTTSPGTDYGMAFFDKYQVPYVELSIPEVMAADEESLNRLCETVRESLNARYDKEQIVLGIGGPRASENAEAFEAARKFTAALLGRDGEVRTCSSRHPR